MYLNNDQVRNLVVLQCVAMSCQSFFFELHIRMTSLERGSGKPLFGSAIAPFLRLFQPLPTKRDPGGFQVICSMSLPTSLIYVLMKFWSCRSPYPSGDDQTERC